jgi:small subunit ribosomal protein S17
MPKRRMTGTVSSNKMNKTIVVRVESTKVHPKYLKRYKVFKKFPARAEGEFAVGDKVEIEETKPISKTVHWIVVRKLE